jgi:hypothetical protein
LYSSPLGAIEPKRLITPPGGLPTSFQVSSRWIVIDGIRVCATPKEKNCGEYASALWKYDRRHWVESPIIVGRRGLPLRYSLYQNKLVVSILDRYTTTVYLLDLLNGSQRLLEAVGSKQCPGAAFPVSLFGGVAVVAHIPGMLPLKPTCDRPNGVRLFDLRRGRIQMLAQGQTVANAFTNGTNVVWFNAAPSAEMGGIPYGSLAIKNLVTRRTEMLTTSAGMPEMSANLAFWANRFDTEVAYDIHQQRTYVLPREKVALTRVTAWGHRLSWVDSYATPGQTMVGLARIP